MPKRKTEACAVRGWCEQKLLRTLVPFPTPRLALAGIDDTGFRTHLIFPVRA